MNWRSGDMVIGKWVCYYVELDNYITRYLFHAFVAVNAI